MYDEKESRCYGTIANLKHVLNRVRVTGAVKGKFRAHDDYFKLVRKCSNRL